MRCGPTRLRLTRLRLTRLRLTRLRLRSRRPVHVCVIAALLHIRPTRCFRESRLLHVINFDYDVIIISVSFRIGLMNQQYMFEERCVSGDHSLAPSRNRRSLSTNCVRLGVESQVWFVTVVGNEKVWYQLCRSISLCADAEIHLLMKEGYCPCRRLRRECLCHLSLLWEAVQGRMVVFLWLFHRFTSPDHVRDSTYGGFPIQDVNCCVWVIKVLLLRHYVQPLENLTSHTFPNSCILFRCLPTEVPGCRLWLMRHLSFHWQPLSPCQCTCSSCTCTHSYCPQDTRPWVPIYVACSACIEASQYVPWKRWCFRQWSIPFSSWSAVAISSEGGREAGKFWNFMTLPRLWAEAKLFDGASGTLTSVTASFLKALIFCMRRLALAFSCCFFLSSHFSRLLFCCVAFLLSIKQRLSSDILVLYLFMRSLADLPIRNRCEQTTDIYVTSVTVRIVTSVTLIKSRHHN